MGNTPLLLPGAQLLNSFDGLTPTERFLSRYIWLTDLEVPDKAALALELVTLNCNRTNFRYRVDGEAVHWAAIRPLLRAECGQDELDLLEDGRSPMHWWGAELPIPAVFDDPRWVHPVGE